jgi:hypothetical protein
MIRINKLTTADIGRWVTYQPFMGEPERGRIKGWSARYIFVVYHCDGHWNDFRNYTAAATQPRDLNFAPAPGP